LPGPPAELRGGRRLKGRRAGDWGEDLALRYLEAKGYDLVERNYRTRYGELDLVMSDGATLVFVEVKLRRGTGYGDPLEAVTPRKQLAVRSMAEQYLAERNLPAFDAARFDVIGILAGAGEPRIEHVEDAF
jgi:putative endonuclease